MNIRLYTSRLLNHVDILNILMTMSKLIPRVLRHAAQPFPHAVLHPRLYIDLLNDLFNVSVADGFA
jgi:hypothetical protein